MEEVRKKILPFILLISCWFASVGNLSAQVKSCTFKDGNMRIELSKHLSKASLDTFMRAYNLTDLPLSQFIKTNSFDSLQRLGWKLEFNDPNKFIITKPLSGSADIGDFAKKIIYTEKIPGKNELFPPESDDLVYGFNVFTKNKFPFRVNGAEVLFFLKGNLQARKVMLAGSFNDWNPDALSMTKTDSGWVARVKINPGKYWYKFVVDGNWVLDNDNLHSENDGYGNVNSVYFKTNVTFTLDSFNKAKRVYLAGSFNNWRDKELLMNKTANGWAIRLYLAQGTHTYKFVIDGTWYTNPRNEHLLPDGHGGYNSVLSMGNAYVFKLDGYTNAKQVILSGTFNGWREDELYMKKTATGWELPYILRSGNYEYKFIVDGKWITDPANPLMVDNDAGSKNSYLVTDPNYTFRLKGYPNAKKVYVAGDFNNWTPSSLQMSRVGDEWIYSVHLSHGKHKYKFQVDGIWITDPANKLWEQNEYGTGNSVVWIDD